MSPNPLPGEGGEQDCQVLLGQTHGLDGHPDLFQGLDHLDRDTDAELPSERIQSGVGRRRPTP